MDTLDTSPDASVEALRREWARLQFTHGGADPAPDVAARSPWGAAVVALARRLVAQRSRLFAANATLQAEAPSDDDPAMIAQVEANQDDIKTCTTVLTEMTAALGRASIPA